LTALLGNIQQIYRPVAEDNRQELEMHLADHVQVSGDQELLLQMFSNLVENAICHTPEHTRIRLELHRGPDRQVIAAVADNGPGIPPPELPKVTRRFYRLSTSRSAPGHGLGLALVNAIAELHGGTLRLSDAHPGLKVEVEFAGAEA
jgi:signal transduction histidine kinase